jgi:hypothetical protein
MAAGSTYTPIATTTFGSATNSYTFTSISGGYTDLLLVASNITNASSTNSLFLRFNGDSGTNYSSTFMEGTGTLARAFGLANRNVVDTGYYVGLSTSNPGQINFSIMNYSNATTYKTVLSRFQQASGAAPGTAATISLWRNTAAITSVEVRCDVNLGIGTTLTLYGLKAA